jgi:hypothetical protein
MVVHSANAEEEPVLQIFVGKLLFDTEESVLAQPVCLFAASSLPSAVNVCLPCGGILGIDLFNRPSSSRPRSVGQDPCSLRGAVLRCRN